MTLFDSIGGVTIAVPSIEGVLPADTEALELEATSDVVTSQRLYERTAS